MKTARTLYDHTPSVPLPVDRGSAASSTTSLTLAHAAGNSSTIVLVQPIVGTAIRIHDKLLQTIDPALWAKMEKLGVEPQLYGIRWLRLLFSREFPIMDTLQLWDGLFAEDASLRLIEYVCIAMLLRIRDALLASDYSGFLQLLLRYPAPADGNHRVSLLIQQATLIRDNVSEAVGEQCRRQNMVVGAQAGEPSGEDSDDDGPRGLGMKGLMRGRNGNGNGIGGKENLGTAAALLAEGGGFVGEIAKGVYGRAEAMGFNKALFGTFSEIRRGVNGANAPPRDSLSVIPSSLPWDRPATPVRDYLTEIARLKASNLAMSKAIGLCVDVVERQLVVSARKDDEGEIEETTTSRDALMAMTALKHVKDVLAGQESSFDPNVLSPLLYSLDDGREVFPSPHPSTPEVSSSTTPSTPPPPPPMPPPPTTPKPSVAPPNSNSMARSFSTESTNSSPSTPPLLPSSTHRPITFLPRTSQVVPTTVTTLNNSKQSKPTLPPSNLDRPLPSRPIPPWESNRLGSGFARLGESSTPALPRPPTASVGRAPLATASARTAPLATFPPTNFSTTALKGPRGEKLDKDKGKKTSVVIDPLGVMM